MPLSIGKTVRVLREAKSLRLREVAERAGISVPYLSLVESESRSPSIEKVKALAAALEVPADFLIVVASGAKSSLTSAEPSVKRLMQVLERLLRLEQELRNEIEAETE